MWVKPSCRYAQNISVRESLLRSLSMTWAAAGSASSKHGAATAGTERISAVSFGRLGAIRRVQNAVAVL